MEMQAVSFRVVSGSLQLQKAFLTPLKAECILTSQLQRHLQGMNKHMGFFLENRKAGQEMCSRLHQRLFKRLLCLMPTLGLVP